MTGKTAAELVVDRADVRTPNMALTNWSGSRVRKHDVIVAKNYLTADEIDTLNRLVVIFLDQAELRAKNRRDLSLDYWRSNVDDLLRFNEREILKGPGAVSHEAMKQIAGERYEKFDQHRRSEEAQQADAADLREIEKLEKRIKPRPSKEDDGA